jgi:DNA mismatch repair protein MutL
MPRIAVLPPAVADQIAAGEVVERPASVVKELVENALDAGATTVDITIEDGGRALVRVADNGSGMAPDDALLALARHATSKITSAEQLVGVRSFGFRGEALPAIASVSELQLETAPADGAGTMVRVAAGHVVEVQPAARRQGTTVAVHRLFYNTPARLKFLRGARAEWRAIIDAVQAVAVLRRDVHLTVRHDGRLALDLPAAPSLRARLAALWGAEAVGAYLDVDDVLGPVHVTGLVERPADVGTATRRTLLVVNGRLVRDPGLLRAAEAAYRSTVPSGARPSLVLQLQLPGHAVDVNVHPAKAEVRLHDRWPVERTVEQAVRRALGLFDASVGLERRGWGGFGAPPARPVVPEADPVVALPTAAPALPGLFAPDAVARGDAWSPRPPSVAGADATDPAGGGALPGATQGSGVHGTPSAEPAAEPIVVPPLLQLRRMYLMFEHDDGVVLIDQHSAHERVLYERFLGVLERGEAPAQRLLFPLTLHVGGREADAFEAHREHFARLGFEMEPFGGHALLVHAVPMPHPRFDAERCLRETLAVLAGDRHAAAAARHERLAATVACKAAIKAGEQLSPGEMRALYVALATTTLPAHDVHGRATIVRLGWDELDRRFGRA